MRKNEPDIGRMYRMSMLLDTYGSLLTEKQHNFMRLHYEQDLSFGEIAKSYEVSRQAVHDSVKHAERTLENLEAKLGLVDQGVFPDERREIAEVVLDLKQRVRRQGIIYNTEWIVHELSEIVERLVGRVDDGGETVDDFAAEPIMVSADV